MPHYASTGWSTPIPVGLLLDRDTGEGLYHYSGSGRLTACPFRSAHPHSSSSLAKHGPGLPIHQWDGTRRSYGRAGHCIGTSPERSTIGGREQYRQFSASRLFVGQPK